MKHLALLLIFLLMASTLTGCLIRTRSHSRGHARARSCPPAHHWDGYSCVHNGRGRGPKVRDHRR